MTCRDVRERWTSSRCKIEEEAATAESRCAALRFELAETKGTRYYDACEDCSYSIDECSELKECILNAERAIRSLKRVGEEQRARTAELREKRRHWITVSPGK